MALEITKPSQVKEEIGLSIPHPPSTPQPCSNPGLSTPKAHCQQPLNTFSIAQSLPLLSQRDVTHRMCLTAGFGRSTLDGVYDMDKDGCWHTGVNDRVSEIKSQPQPLQTPQTDLLTFDGSYNEGKALHKSNLADTSPTRMLLPSSLLEPSREQRKTSADETARIATKYNSKTWCGCPSKFCPYSDKNCTPLSHPPSPTHELIGGHFPESFSFFRHKTTNHDVVIGDSNGDNQYCFISVNNSNQRIRVGGIGSWLSLHSGTTKACPRLAMIVWPERTINHVGIDIRPEEVTPEALHTSTERAPSHRRGSATYQLFEEYWPFGYSETLQETKEAKSFEFKAFIQETGKKEKFQWQNCVVERIPGLEDGMGKRLVRVETQEIVAGWTRPKGWGPLERKKHGMMVFLGCWQTLGQDFEILAVMSILVSMKVHRNICGTRCSSTGWRPGRFPRGQGWPLS